MRRIEVPALIVGAGPVGLTMSLLLTGQGIRNVVVDRRPGPHRAPQAHVVNPRTLEIFRQIGIDTARLRALATPREDGGHVSWSITLAGEELGRLPYERQGDDAFALTPEPIVNLPQHVLEPVLLDYLDCASPSRRGDASPVTWRHEWRSLRAESSADAAVSLVHDLSRGEDIEIRSRWLLAADGAGSPVRKQLGIAMLGPDHLQSFVMIHFEANLRAVVRDKPAILYWMLDPDCIGSFVAHDIDRTWVFMRPYDAAVDGTEADACDPARCAALVRRAIGRDDVRLEVRDTGVWHMTSQVAETYGRGNVFLVGDSAHRFPPAGGMGMNTGIQDAHNLAWKIAMVEKGATSAGLLDTYETERRPVARRNADQSLVNAMRMLASVGELGLGGDAASARDNLAALLATSAGRARIAAAIEAQRDHFDMLGLQLGYFYETGAIVPDGTPVAPVDNPVRDFIPSGRPGARLPHGWIERDGARCSSLDLVAVDAFTLIAGREAGASAASAARAWKDGGRVPLRVLVSGRDFIDPGGEWHRACELEPSGALLLRPDQHVAWRVRADARSIPVDVVAALS